MFSGYLNENPSLLFECDSLQQCTLYSTQWQGAQRCPPRCYNRRCPWVNTIVYPTSAACVLCTVLYICGQWTVVSGQRSQFTQLNRAPILVGGGSVINGAYHA